ncbi:MAG TPA: hypothetical protein PKD53_05725 [Chloroflexaceae bacterium]|nr:hypothetical protein [Chloroflexaceae bacterium]
MHPLIKAPITSAVLFHSCSGGFPLHLCSYVLLDADSNNTAEPDQVVVIRVTALNSEHFRSVFTGALLLVASRLFPHAALRQAGVSWLLHILVDLPSHRRDPWGPRPLWPLSELAFDGVGWADALVAWIARTVRSTGE